MLVVRVTVQRFAVRAGQRGGRAERVRRVNRRRPGAVRLTDQRQAVNIVRDKVSVAVKTRNDRAQLRVRVDQILRSLDVPRRVRSRYGD